jgi:hypothetical protein
MRIGVNAGLGLGVQISGNSGLNGSGVAVLGDCCPLLRELKVSRCVGLSEWALERVFHGCGKLEVVDLSYLPQLKDQLVKDMAEAYV